MTTPDADLVAAINALPHPVRAFVHELETRCDPAGEVRELFCARQEVLALRATLDAALAERDEAQKAARRAEQKYHQYADIWLERGFTTTPEGEPELHTTLVWLNTKNLLLTHDCDDLRARLARAEAALGNATAAMEWAFHHLDRGDGGLEVTDTLENVERAESQRKAALAHAPAPRPEEPTP